MFQRTTDWFLVHWPLRQFTAYADGLLHASWKIRAKFAAGSVSLPALYFILFHRSAAAWTIGLMLGVFALIGWLVPTMGGSLIKRSLVRAAQALTVLSFGVAIAVSVWLAQMLLRAMGLIG